MDPVSLIITALVAGAAAGIGDSATDAVKEAYSVLKRKLKGAFAGDAAAEVALDQHAEDPETWKAPLEKALKSHGAGEDEAVLEAARRLVELQDPEGAASGIYDLRGAKGVSIGDHNIQTNYFGR